MGKLLRVTAVFTDDEPANNFSAKHKNQAVVAVFGRYILMADAYDRGLEYAPKYALERILSDANLSAENIARAEQAITQWYGR